MKATRFACSAVLALAGMAVSARPSAAQETAGDGFLFGAPRGSLTLRGGVALPAARSDLFSFVTNELTLRRGDFAAFGYGADLSLVVRPRLDVVLSADRGGMKKKSEFRKWQDDSGNPIEQSTSFARTSLSMSLKYYLLPYGRPLGRFAWVPTRYAPWVSAGVGRTYYRFFQVGDFVDFANGNAVFGDRFESSAWGFTPQVAAGLDFSVNQRFAVTTQAKYLFGKADLGTDYSGFSPIDLSGLGLTGGLSIRF